MQSRLQYDIHIVVYYFAYSLGDFFFSNPQSYLQVIQAACVEPVSTGKACNVITKTLSLFIRALLQFQCASKPYALTFCLQISVSHLSSTDERGSNLLERNWIYCKRELSSARAPVQIVHMISIWLQSPKIQINNNTAWTGKATGHTTSLVAYANMQS